MDLGGAPWSKVWHLWLTQTIVAVGALPTLMSSVSPKPEYQ